MSTGKTNEELPEELKNFEAALRQLTPQAGQIDRDRLMYLAGQASAHPTSTNSVARFAKYEIRMPRNLWPLATAVLALIGVGLGGLLLRSSRPGERIMFVERQNAIAGSQPNVVSFAPLVSFPSVMATSAGGANYVLLRNLILTRGVDALPETPTSDRSATPQSELPTLPALGRELLGGES